MKYEDIRQQVIDASLQASRMGLIRGTSGNISVRSSDGKVIAITPTSIPYEQLTPGMVPLVLPDGTIVEGEYKPSSEMPMHTAILRSRPDLNAVVHTHSKFATVLSIIGQTLPVLTIPLIAYAPAGVPIVPFQLPGSVELAEAVAAALVPGCNAIMMESHGLLVAGDTLEHAMSGADYVEEGAEIALYCYLATKEIKGISEEQIKKLLAILSGGRAL